MIPDPEEQPVMSIPDAGKAFGMGRSAAYEAAKNGAFPTLQVGGRTFVITALLRQQLGLDTKRAA